MIERWWEEAERHQVLPARQPAVLRARVPAHAVGARRGLGTRTGPAARPCPRAWPSTCGRARTTSPPTSPSRTTSTCSRACSPCRARCSAGGRSTSSATGGSATCTTWPAGAMYRVEADIGRLAPGDHTLAFRFRPPAAELLVDGEVVGTGEVKRTVWSRLLAHRRRPHRRLVTRLQPRRRATTAAASRSPACCTASTSTSTASRWSTRSARPRTSSPRSSSRRSSRSS